MQEIKIYKTKDLVLSISKTYDPIKLDFLPWERFLDILTANRSYQVDAIKTAIVYLAGGRYKTIEDLVKENWNDSKNSELQTRYRNLDEYNSAIQLPSRLSGNIDIATGAGKSYVMYGVAQIALALGLVDKVLLLCPSLTIEKELKKKFVQLSGDSALKQALPGNSRYLNPRIIDGNSTIKDGDICIENIHAAYEKTGSSLRDSLLMRGQRVLVLNDESHHIYNKVDGNTSESKDLKKWKEFLLSTEFNFNYILGFTGTAYRENDYFNDVIYRYSLRQAVDDRMVKMVDYITKNDDALSSVKFQEILDNHDANASVYRKVKPLTILITKDIRNAKQLQSEFASFLIEDKGMDEETVKNLILIVSSSAEHKLNVARLGQVDNLDDPTQFIISVSMLTEGWDVKNVFQIVPWEDRAFNSKLLIAQVLGRGLRIPIEYASAQPKVRVFNHDAWSRNIRGLVDELLEMELRLYSNPINNGERSKFHLNLYNIDYERIGTEKESSKEHTIFDYTKGYINLAAQSLQLEKDTEYTDLAGVVKSKNTLITYNSYTVEEVVNKIYDDLNAREWEGKILQLPEGKFTKNELPPKEQIYKLISQSMANVGIQGNRIDENNRQKILSSFSTLLRKRGKTIQNIRKVSTPIQISTSQSEKESISVGSLKNRTAAFYSDNYEEEMSNENLKMLQDLLTSNEDSLESKYNLNQINPYLLKTPFDIIFVSHEPELKFINRLVKKDNAQFINAWFKSRDQGFYGIEYSMTSIAGKHSKTQKFNPDFFVEIIKGEIHFIIVIETKADGDNSEENRAKYRYAKQHFGDLNKELAEMGVNQQYIFHFLSPNSYDVFFKYLRDGILTEGKFKGELELLLDEELL